MNRISIRQVFNLIHTHLLNKTEHSPDCAEKPGRGLVCAADCGTRRFLDWLDEPFTPWEIREAERMRERRKALMRGEIPA